MCKPLWHTLEKENVGWTVKAGCHFVYTVMVSTQKYIRHCGQTTTTRTKGNPRTLSSRHGLPAILPSTTSSTDPFWVPLAFCRSGCGSSVQDGVETCNLPGKRNIDVLPVHELFLVSTLTITFGQVSASLCSLYVAEIWIMCIRFFKALLQR